jgi:hypothetical protein
MCGIDLGGYIHCQGTAVGTSGPSCPTWIEGGEVVDGDECDLGGISSGGLRGVVSIPNEPISAVACSSGTGGSIDEIPWKSFCCGITSYGEPTCWGGVPNYSPICDGISASAMMDAYTTDSIMHSLPPDFVNVPEWLSPIECSVAD